MIDWIVSFIKKNYPILEILLLAVAISLLIYIVMKVPIIALSCLDNPMNYYESISNASCWCDDMVIGFIG